MNEKNFLLGPDSSQQLVIYNVVSPSLPSRYVLARAIELTRKEILHKGFVTAANRAASFFVS